jgi:hypothetical protein
MRSGHHGLSALRSRGCSLDLRRDGCNRGVTVRFLSREPISHDTGGAALNANAKNAATPRKAKATR